MKKIKDGFGHRKLLLNFDGLENEDFDSRRKILRDQILAEFMVEPPGIGRGVESSRWIYCVEDGCLDSKIYIQRPAVLNKGMDFIVSITRPMSFFAPTENDTLRTTSTPRHDSMYFPIAHIRDTDMQQYNLLLIYLKTVYLCHNATKIEKTYLREFSKIYEYSPTKNVKLKIDCLTIARTIKWLFLEQDVTYWNWSGRKMLWNALSEKFIELGKI